MKAIKYFFTAALPKRMGWYNWLIYGILVAAIPAGIFLAWTHSDWTIWHKCWTSGTVILMVMLFPWILYFFLHLVLGIGEAIAVSCYKIKEAYVTGTPLKAAPEDYYIARYRCEAFGPIRRPQIELHKAIEENTIDSQSEMNRMVEDGLSYFMKNMTPLKDRMTDDMIDDFAHKLNGLRQQTPPEGMESPISKDKVDIAPYEIPTVIFNFTRYLPGINKKVLSEYCQVWFPENYKTASSLKVYFSKLQARVDDRDGVVKHRPADMSTRTKTPLLERSNLENPVKYFAELPEKNL